MWFLKFDLPKVTAYALKGRESEGEIWCFRGKSPRKHQISPVFSPFRREGGRGDGCVWWTRGFLWWYRPAKHPNSPGFSVPIATPLLGGISRDFLPVNINLPLVVQGDQGIVHLLA
jgi:hypothetical protein